LIGNGGFIYKSKGEIGSRNNRPHRRGQKHWQEITVAGVKTGAACLGELTITWKRD